MALTDSIKDQLAFWQSRSFYTLENKAGKLLEREAGTTRPKGLPFVKGGRRAALAEAERTWGKLESPAKPEAKRPVAENDGRGDAVQGERPDQGKPLEPEEPALISERPVRISSRREPVTGQRSVRITPDTMPRHGLPR